MIRKINQIIVHISGKQLLRPSLHAKRLATLLCTPLSTHTIPGVPSFCGVESEAKCDYEREFVEINANTFASLATNEHIESQIQLILSEYEYQKYTTLAVSSTLTIRDMRDLLSAKSAHERGRMFLLFYRREMKKMEKNILKKEKSEDISRRKAEKWSDMNAPISGLFDRKGELVYGLWHNCLFTRVNKNSVSRLVYNKLRVSAMFAQKLVIDLSFDQMMTYRDCQLLANQIKMLCYHNKFRAIEPFDLHFTNCNINSPTIQCFDKFYQNCKYLYFQPKFYSESYLDLFSRDKLVYLTPHATNTIEEYNHDDIYILSGAVGRESHKPFAFAKAFKEGIRAYKLPINEHINWSCGGSKTLLLGHILAILDDVKMNGDWSTALKNNIPQRKQKSENDIIYENSLRLEKLRKCNTQS